MSARRKLRKKQLALKLGMHPDTLCLRIQQAGIHSHHYSPITNDELDVLIHEYRCQKPNAGICYVWGWLFSHGVRVQKEWVRLALRQIDGLHQSLAYHGAIDHRVYEVTRPHSLWHLDGHHKLIRWRIAWCCWWVFLICKFLQCFDPIDVDFTQVVGMRASANNLASTVLDLFLDAAAIHGAPSRVRGDRGSENLDVSVWMIMHRGPNRASFMWGRWEY